MKPIALFISLSIFSFQGSHGKMSYKDFIQFVKRSENTFYCSVAYTLDQHGESTTLTLQGSPQQSSGDRAIGYRKLLFSRNRQVSEGLANRNKKTIPVSLWYPIDEPVNDELTKISNRYYVSTIKQGNTAAENEALFDRMLNSFGTIDTVKRTELVNSFLNTNISVYNAPDYPEGKYPIVIICGAHPIYHTDLAESLARNGFVVASFPRLGFKDGQRLPFSQEGSLEYGSDLRFVVATLSGLAAIDTNRLSVIAWSFEGVPAFEAASSIDGTDLFISLDSSLGYGYGSTLVADSTSFYR